MGKKSEPQAKQLHDLLMGHDPQVEKDISSILAALLSLYWSQLDEQTGQFNNFFV